MVREHTVAYCGGTFDLLHPGHVEFLRWAKSRYEVVVVALNTDEFVARYKGFPVQSFEERKCMLESCRFVDKVVENTFGEDSKPTVLSVRPTHIVNGSDWNRERLMQQMSLTESFLSTEGIEIILCTKPRGQSTTELKRRVRTQL